jgi:hypothetical protein
MRGLTGQPDRLRAGVASLFAAGCLLGLPACTSVTVYAGDGSVAVHRGLGFMSLQPAPGTTPMVLRSTSLGMQSGPWGHSLGYAKTSLTLLPAGCHLVITFDNDLQAASPALQALRKADPCATPTAIPGEP